jgi:4-hydroxybenzoate polyprenyltransferase
VWPLLKLLRPKNLVMVFVSMVLTKYALLSNFGVSYLSTSRFLLLTLLVCCITGAGYIINDIFDIEADAINKPKKSFIPLAISKKKAFAIYWLFTLFSAILAFSFCTITVHYILFFGTPCALFFYSTHLKKWPLVGNLLISILVCLPIYIVFLMDFIPLNFGGVTFNPKPYTLIYFYMFFAFLTTWIREIIKDIEDITGDLKIKAKTLPILLGRKRTAKVAFFLSSILFLVFLIILKSAKVNYLISAYCTVFIGFPLLLLLYKLWISESKKDFSKLSYLVKIIMFFGIFSMLLI